MIFPVPVFRDISRDIPRDISKMADFGILTSSQIMATTAESLRGISTRTTFGRLADVREINGVLFRGVHYSDTYYKNVEASGSFSQLAYVNGELAGAICCTVETQGRKTWTKNVVTVATIGVLEKFRSQGVGSKLMRHVINTAKSDPCTERIVLSVHIHNERAISFYKKFGFEVTSFMKMAINGAWIMEFRIRTIT